MKQAVQPLRIAIIGCGRMGFLYAQLCNELALTRLVAVSSEDAESTARAGATLEVASYDGGRYNEMLERHPEIKPYAEKLISRWEAGESGHATAIREFKAAVEKCKNMR